jgi:ATP-dependent DNA helicase RecG
LERFNLPLDSSRLREVLEQERKLKYTNKAVFGGLDLFLANWFGQAISQTKHSVRLKTLNKLHPPAFNYGSMVTEERKNWIERVFVYISDEGTYGTKTKTDYIKKSENIVHLSVLPSSKSATTLDSEVNVIKGIANTISERFAKLGVHTIRDLLYFFPNRHLDYSHLKTVSQLKEGTDQTILANVWEVRSNMLGGHRGTEATLGDESGNVRAVWFNNPYVARLMRSGDRVVMSGRVKIFAGRLVFESPEWEVAEDKELLHTGRLVPLYPLTSGLHQRQVRKLVKNVVDDWACNLPEFLPMNISKRLILLNLNEAVAQAHFPHDMLLKDRARVRLAFDELFLLQLGVMAKKRKWQTEQPGVPINVDYRLLDRFLQSLPFKFTQAQQRVSTEIIADLTKPIAMSRLLQGEVGSGKTVVALSALLMAVADGYQGALMAPTEILAIQHFNSISNALKKMSKDERNESAFCSISGITEKPLTVALFTGDIKSAARRELKDKLASGEVNIVIGTHALIQKEVKFNKLGLVVVDEQHRFGVEQRAALRQKGFNPHMLVMTATPIPRTLALTLYGDLDLSVIDELPPGRQEIKTKWFSPAQRDSAYLFLRKQVREGYQGFIICPLVEDSDSVQAKAAVTEFYRLSRDIYPDLRLVLLHGRMAASEKDAVMKSFNLHQADILVSTPVIEVGIDVPNATVMMIESADRFGLSQLHQFRGRVGRGTAQSYCMLMAENPSEISRLRLDIIETTQDGFKLADEDLKLRGPGEFFGTRQSGLPDMRMAKLSDTNILEMARTEAIRLFQEDPNLKSLENLRLAHELSRVWPQKSGEWS